MPALAERGRLDRILGKSENPALVAQSEAALVAALERDPDNGAAHHYFAQLEIDLGRARSALVRLTTRARERRAEPQIYAALVQACRYSGLLSASLAANDHARHLDPAISTSVLHTYYMAGDYARALEEGHRTSDPFEARVLGALGREAEAIDAARREEARFASVPLLQIFATALHAALEGRRPGRCRGARRARGLGVQRRRRSLLPRRDLRPDRRGRPRAAHPRVGR